MGRAGPIQWYVKLDTKVSGGIMLSMPTNTPKYVLKVVEIDGVGRRILKIKLNFEGMNLNGCTAELACHNAPKKIARFQRLNSDKPFAFQVCTYHAKAHFFKMYHPIGLYFTSMSLIDYVDKGLIPKSYTGAAKPTIPARTKSKRPS